MNNPKFTKIAAIVVGIILFIVIVIVAFQLTGAKAADFEPRDVVVANIAKNSVTLSWSTGTDTQGVVEYGTTPTSLNFFAPEPSKTSTHSLDLTLLSPSTTYYFDISIANKKYDNGGVPWTFTTKSAQESVVSSPTATPSGSTGTSGLSPTPVQTLQIPSGNENCNVTDCNAIKAKLGKGCSTQDYLLCVKKVTPTP